jgi:hypothetical protein
MVSLQNGVFDERSIFFDESMKIGVGQIKIFDVMDLGVIFGIFKTLSIFVRRFE